MTKNLLDKASKAYFEGSPFLSDEEFDALAKKDGYERVGYNPDDKQPHLFPLYSLQKVFEGEDTPPVYKSKVIETPKLDGAAISIHYKKGKLFKVTTRGDGTVGVDVTDKFMLSDIIPKGLWSGLEFKDFDNLQITGEIVAPKEIPNARNYAAGALNLKDVNEFRNRNLTFIAYSVEPSISPFYKTDMSSLLYEGFNVVTSGEEVDNWNEFPNDGKVIRVDDNKEYSDYTLTPIDPAAVQSHIGGANTTTIDGGNIDTGTVTADRLQVGERNLTASRLLLLDDSLKIFEGTTLRVHLGNLSNTDT